MARIRTIKPEFWTSEQVMECSPITRLLFVGLWNFCDDNGVHSGSLKTIKAEIFPCDDIGLDDIRRMVAELSENGLLHLYRVNGKRYLQVTGWSKHQKIEKPSFKHPGPDHLSAQPGWAEESATDEDRRDPRLMPLSQPPKASTTGRSEESAPPETTPSTIHENTGFYDQSATSRRPFDDHQPPEGNGMESNGREVSSNGASGDAPEDQIPPSNKPPAKQKPATEYPERFEQLWQSRPRRQGSDPKREAFRCYRARLKDGHTHDEIAAGWERYSAFLAAQGKLNTEFVMQAKRFLGPELEFTKPWTPPHPLRPGASSAREAKRRAVIDEFVRMGEREANHG